MAYGSTKSISDSILAATDGESIQEQIDAYMQSSASGTTGDGLIAAATINQDTDAAVSAMRKKSLGARESQAKAQKAVVNDKLASVGRDWLTLMQGDGQANASEISEKRSILLAEVEDIPTTELTDDQYFLRTGKKRPDYADDPDVFTKDGSDNISGSGASLAERSGGVMNFTAGDIDLSKFVVFDDSGDTGNGLMSSLRPQPRPDNLIEDIQLQQDIDLDPIVIAKPVLIGKPIVFSENNSSGSVEGLVNTFSVNGVDRPIIDVGQTTISESYYSAKPRIKINPQNVVMHYTAAEYKNGVRHYMNSFQGVNDVTAAFFVDKDGKIYQTFDPTVKGAHIAGRKTKNPNQIITNSNSIGVEVEATDNKPPNAKQLEASSWLADYLTAQYGTNRVVAHPQANIHKGHIEGFDIVNHWRKGKGLPELTVSKKAIKNLLTLAPSRSLRPQMRPN